MKSNLQSWEIKVFAPATVANIACGFDIFGFALEIPGDEIYVKLKKSSGITLHCITRDGERLPDDPEKNSAGASLLALIKRLKTRQGFEIELRKKMPLCSGLGSSAASAAGSVFAANLLLGSPFSKMELIPFAMEGERAACSVAHADNVAPALLGGFTLIRSYTPLEVISIPCPIELYCTILHPKIEILTSVARKILSPTITLKQHVTQTGNAAGLVVGLMEGNPQLIGRCLEDVIVEPIRSTLIPGLAFIKKAALDGLALGCSISGSGPSLFALSLNRSHAEQIGEKMTQACREQHLDCELFISKINYEGVRVI